MIIQSFYSAIFGLFYKLDKTAPPPPPPPPPPPIFIYFHIKINLEREFVKYLHDLFAWSHGGLNLSLPKCPDFRIMFHLNILLKGEWDCN